MSAPNSNRAPEEARDLERMATPSVVAAVLSRLPDADRARASARRRQLQQRLGALTLSTILLLACLGPQASNLATRALVWVLAADVAWRVLVSILLGGLSVLPALSAVCLVAVSLLLWQQFIRMERHGL